MRRKIFKSIQLFFLTISCILILSGCSRFIQIYENIHPRGRCAGIAKQQKAWNILVYLNADNDLGEFITNRSKKIQAAASSKNVNIIIQFDGNRPNDSKRFYLKRNDKIGTLEHIVCKKDIEYDMVNPKTLTKFIAWGMKNFPSKRTAVIIAGHGMGILNIPKKSSRKIFSPLGLYPIPSDYFSYDRLWHHMDLQQMVSQLTPILKKYNNGKTIDLIAFDSCQMGNFETLMTLSPVAAYAIASEYPITYKENMLKQDDDYGLPIGSLIRNLSQYPDNTVSETGMRVIKRFDQVYKDFGFYHSRSGKTFYPESSLALYDLSYTPVIKNYVKTMAEELMVQANRKPELFEALFIELLKSHAICHPVGYLDLAHFAEMIYRVSGLKSAKTLLLQINNTNRFVLDKAIHHTVSDLPLSGVSIFFPGSITAGQDTILQEFSTYAGFKITKETGLSSLLNNYLKAVKRKRAKILTRIVNGHVNHGKKFQFKPSEGKYDEHYLFTITEISLYPLLENGDYDTVKRYLKKIVGSGYKSHYFEKHKKDLQRYLLKLREKETDFNRSTKLRELINVIADMKNEPGLE